MKKVEAKKWKCFKFFKGLKKMFKRNKKQNRVKKLDENVNKENLGMT